MHTEKKVKKKHLQKKKKKGKETRKQRVETETDRQGDKVQGDNNCEVEGEMKLRKNAKQTRCKNRK